MSLWKRYKVKIESYMHFQNDLFVRLTAKSKRIYPLKLFSFLRSSQRRTPR